MCMNSFYPAENGIKQYLEVISEHKIYLDMREMEYEFVWQLFNHMKPKNVLCIGGYHNFDAIFSCKDLPDCSIVNVDPIAFEERNHVIDRHNLIMQRTQYQGKYKWIQEKADSNKIANSQWDVVWESGDTRNHIDAPCFNEVSKSLGNFSNKQIYIKYTYGFPPILYGQIPIIDESVPIQAIGKTIAVFGNIENDIKQVLGNSYYQQGKKINFPFNIRRRGKRVIPFVGWPGMYKQFIDHNNQKAEWRQ